MKLYAPKGFNGMSIQGHAITVDSDHSITCSDPVIVGELLSHGFKTAINADPVGFKVPMPEDSAVTVLRKAIDALPGDQDDVEYVVNSMRSHFGTMLFTGDVERTVRAKFPTKVITPESTVTKQPEVPPLKPGQHAPTRR